MEVLFVTGVLECACNVGETFAFSIWIKPVLKYKLMCWGSRDMIIILQRITQISWDKINYIKSTK